MTTAQDRYRAQQLTKSTARVAGTDLIVNSGTGRMGAQRHPAPGGSAASVHNILAVPFAQALAESMCIPEDVALKILKHIGVVAQRRLLEGKPCGIPFVGTLAIREEARYATERRRARLLDAIATLEARAAAGYTGTAKLTVQKLIAAKRTSLGKIDAIQRSAHLHLTALMADLFRQNAAYHAPVKSFAREEWNKEGRHWTCDYHLTVAEKKALLEQGVDLPRPNPIPNVPKVKTHEQHYQRTIAARRRSA